MVSQSKLGLTAAMLLGSAMAGGSGGPRRRPHDPLDGVDLEAEYELIKQKKSRLSSNQRDRVVSIVESAREQKEK